jgi:hypothetical protein
MSYRQQSLNMYPMAFWLIVLRGRGLRENMNGMRKTIMTLKIRYSKFATGTLYCFLNLILWEMVDLKVNMPRSQLVHRLTGLTVLASGLFGNRPFLIVRL